MLVRSVESGLGCSMIECVLDVTFGRLKNPSRFNG